MKTTQFIASHIKPYRIYIAGILLGTFLLVIDSTLKPFLLKRFIDIVSHQKSENIWLVFMYYAILQSLLVSAWLLIDYCLTKYTNKFRLTVADVFMNKLYDYPYTFYQKNLTGTLTAKCNDAFQYLPEIIFTIINTFFYFILLLIVSLILLFFVSPFFAISMIIWTILFFSISYFTTKKVIKLNKQYAEEKATTIGLINDYLANIMTIKLFSNKTFEHERFNELQKPFLEISYKKGIYTTQFYALLNTLTWIYTLSVIAALILGYKYGIVTPGDFALVIMTNLNIINTLTQLSFIFRSFIKDLTAVSKAIELLDYKNNTLVDSPNAQTLACPHGNISFQQVKFGYKDGETLFQNKSIDIKAGEKVGLVGYSGGGKTTFVNLILRLYDVTEGAILIDNQDIREVTQDSLRSKIAIIPQDPLLFHRSVMDNIRYGRITATDQEVIAAAKEAHAHDFIIRLSDGYDTLVGERGTKLSGGQRQRIAIARAILKNAPILILDEATSQLDSITERLIQESLWKLMENKTTIIVAHRLSTLLHMDRILVFEKGKIVEDGTHAQLVNHNGLYRHLWNLQAGIPVEDKNTDEGILPGNQGN